MAKKEETQQEDPKLEVNKIKEIIESAKQADKENQQKNENKPTDDEVNNAKKDFEEASNDFSVYKWQIGKKENAQKLLNYLQNFIQNRIFWSKNGWMGVLKFKEEVDEAQQRLNTGQDDAFTMGYQALEFGFYSLSNPGGIGYDSAKKMESENDIYVELLEGFGTALEDARQKLEDVHFLQNRWASMSQGFYLEKEDGVKEAEMEKEKQKDPSSNK